MGEIKSTLDLVMARTQHLTMTDEEKRKQQSEKVTQRLQGLIQKFQDRAINLQQLQNALDKYEEKEGHEVGGLLVDIVAGRIGLIGDNTALFTVLETVCRIDTSNVKKHILEFQISADQLKRSREEALLAYFSDTYQVSGSAVVPNVAKDDLWQTENRRLMEAHQAQLADEFRNL